MDSMSRGEKADANGSITPPTQSILYGNSATFTVNPNIGYDAKMSDNYGANGTSAGAVAGNIYTIASITAACTATANFSLQKLAVTASATSTNGTITPQTQTVDYGTAANFILAANAGYKASATDTCCAGGGKVGTLIGNAYAIASVTRACAVTANFTAAALQPTTVSLGLSPLAPSAGHAVTFTATVTPVGNAGNVDPSLAAAASSGQAVLAAASTPTGTVTFTDNGVGLGSVAVNGNTASLTTTLAAGQHSLSAAVQRRRSSCEPSQRRSDDHGERHIDLADDDGGADAQCVLAGHAGAVDRHAGRASGAQKRPHELIRPVGLSCDAIHEPPE